MRRLLLLAVAVTITAAAPPASAGVTDTSLLSGAALRDYRAWLALGPGGLPANVGGWLVATWLRQFTRETTSVAMYAGAPAPDVPLALPPRAGGRPATAPWPIPHRQSDQLPPSSPLPGVQALTGEIAAEAPGDLRIATSRFERRGPAVFVSSPTTRARWVRAARGEAGHVHASDGSLHLVLHPADAKVVIDAGWGERHPLAGVPLFGIPTNYLMVYAPRDDEELAIVRMLFRRAAGG